MQAGFKRMRGFAFRSSFAPGRLARYIVTAGLPDLIAERLDVLFCGINPGMAAAAEGHHFVGRSNRFWRVIHRSGFTPEEISPQDDQTILRYRCGVTSVVKRPTARADELAPEEFGAAAGEFEQKIMHFVPRHVAFLGKAAYAGMTRQREVTWGMQPNRMQGSVMWVLPNPSGRNRSFSLDRLVEAYRRLYLEVLATSDGHDLARPLTR
jgi:TDG/mug DNA glycosylase family protein